MQIMNERNNERRKYEKKQTDNPTRALWWNTYYLQLR